MTEFVETGDFDIVPGATEPPEGDVELALQEDLLATESPAPAAPAPPVVGRTYKLDLVAGRLLPAGRAPASIYGAEAMRQAVEKVMRTPRGAAAAQGDDYGRETPDRDIEGQAFDDVAFAEAEESIRDAILALPWVLAVEDFDAVETTEDDDSGASALVTFRVVPEGDAEPIDFDRYPLPT
jgi:hypothetical protein